MKAQESTEGNIPFQKANLKWQGSLFLYLGNCLHSLFSIFSVMAWIRKFFEWKKMNLPIWVVELWVIFLSIILFIALFYSKKIAFQLFIAIYVLNECLGSFTRDTIVSMEKHKDEEGGYIGIQHRTRWLLLSLQSIAIVVLSFAVLFRYFGNDFEPTISDGITALYHSLLTFTTLGYGDIKAITLRAKFIVIAELSFFLLFLAIKIPIAVSVLRVKVDPEGPYKNDS